MSRPVVTRLALPLLLLAAACREPLTSGDLLHEPRLQSVVAFQEARDAASLVGLLGDRDPAVRARAAFALGSVQDAAATSDLTALLADDDAEVRAEAAFALGQMPQSSVAVEQALLALLADADSAVRANAVVALGRVGADKGADALANLDPSGPGAREATLALSHMFARGVASPAALDTLVGRLFSADSVVRESAAWGLANAFETGSWRAKRPQVYSALDAYPKDELAAANVLRAVGRVAEPDGRRRLVAWLKESPSWRNRSAAAESLAGDSVPGDRAALIDALNDSSPHVRAAVVEVLVTSQLRAGELDRIAAWVASHPKDSLTAASLMGPLAAGGRGRAVLDWIGRVPGNDPTLRRRAVEAAALLPGEAGLRFLAAAAADTSRAIAGEAVHALAVRWATGERENAALQRTYYDAFVKALAARDPVTDEVLREVLRDPILVQMGSADVVSAAGAPPATGSSTVPPLDWALLGELGMRPRLVLETPRGRVVVEMDTNEAPLTVQTVARLAREGRYDGVPFHRVLPNFMAQGGDVDRGDGMGDPGFHITSELTHIPFGRGVAGMARTDKDTESSQFFLTHSMQPHLDGAYTAFGRVIEGMDAADAIVEGDRITHASVEAGTATTP